MITLPILEQDPGGPAPSQDTVLQKFEQLKARLRACLSEGAVIAFSGGVDSTFLLWAADQVRRESGGRVLALTTVSPSMSQVDREDARRFAERLGVEHLWRESGEFGLEAYRRNDQNRCYYCKSELFDITEKIARERDCRWVMYGYNDSDRDDVRPGHRAALEHGILAPLAEAALTKQDIRMLMRLHDLELSDKPASPCLSSRVMTGLAITPQMLQDVEELETVLREGGLRVFRVRICGEGALRFIRLEVHPDEMASALDLRKTFVRKAKKRGYRWVTLDLEGYRMGGGTT